LRPEVAMHVGAVMSANPYVAEPEENVVEAARRMRARAIGFLPIVRGKQLVGVLSDCDMIDRVVASRRDPERTKVQDVMTARAATCFEDEEVTVAVERMRAHAIERLVVLDRRDRSVAGVLSVQDLALHAETSTAAIDLLRRRAQLRSVDLDGIAAEHPRS
jgi:CBS domain-containing protein